MRRNIEIKARARDWHAQLREAEILADTQELLLRIPSGSGERVRYAQRAPSARGGMSW